MLFAESKINIENFYGIEIDDFAVEVAILSLWIAKHQMNTEFKEKFNVSIPLIPLRETGQIQAGNATRVDWNTVCRNDGGEIYLIGNPPYKGSKYQTKEMKADYLFVFGSRPHSKNLDYVCLWFIKGADYIEGTRAELAFVTTNSVSQGEHVGLLFPIIFAKGIEIGYAYTSFKWENNAKRNAGVTVAVVNLRVERPGPKYIYSNGLQIEAKNINGYLADARSVFVYRRTTPLSQVLPKMAYGSAPRDDGNLVLSLSERDEIVDGWPEAARLIRSFIGAVEFIGGVERYCLWVGDQDVSFARTIPMIARRFDAMVRWRSASERASTVKLIRFPNRFEEVRYKPTDSILVPIVSAERRTYIPMGYVGPDVVISNAANAVYDAKPWLFALLTSSMHMTWTRAVCSRMKTDYRYSGTTVYNNFPVPPLSDEVKDRLTTAALRVLDVREYHCERTLAELYDPDLMPEDLRVAHAEVDVLVDSIYSKRGYETDEQRLSDLFGMYEVMTAAEAAKAPTKKTRGALK